MNLGPNLRYAAGLAKFLRHTLTPDRAREMIEAQLAWRKDAFLRILKLGVYDNDDASPYRALLEHAGLALGDVTDMVQRDGLEASLVKLHDAGVYLTYEEARGIVPLRRGSLELSIDRSSLNNPHLAATYEGSTSGSRGVGLRIRLDLDFIEYDSAQMAVMLASYGALDAAKAVWRPIPPDSSGMKRVLCYTKVGSRPERWWSQSGLQWSGIGAKSAASLVTTLIASRLSNSIPVPHHLTRENAIVVARWLAQKKREGRRGYLDSSASGAIRACLAAKDAGLDISGSLFRTGGEPFTEAKAQVLTEAGCSAVQAYAMAELGYIAIGCTDPSELVDLHIATDKVAVIQRDKQIAPGESVPALVYTSLLPSSPVIMLNMESGDYGRLEQRSCGCMLDAMGLTTHLTGLRSYDKLTSEGVTFIGTELYRLLEEVLPARFGGHATDYQIVEEEVDSLTRISIVVAPGVGPVDEPALVTTVLDELVATNRGAGPPTAEQWRQGGTLRVVRREPYTSGGGRKVLPLHVLPNRDAASK